MPWLWMSQKIPMMLLMLKGLSLLLTRNLWKKPRLSKSILLGWDSILSPTWTLESLDAEVVGPAVPAATDILSILKKRCPGDFRTPFFLAWPECLGSWLHPRLNFSSRQFFCQKNIFSKNSNTDNRRILIFG